MRKIPEGPGLASWVASAPFSKPSRVTGVSHVPWLSQTNLLIVKELFVASASWDDGHHWSARGGAAEDLYNYRAPLDKIIRLSETDDPRHDILGDANIHEEDVVFVVMDDPVQ